jgi:pterin-4a-carbinolamine dehydratase
MNKIAAKKNTNDFTPEWRDKYNELRVALTTNENKK